MTLYLTTYGRANNQVTLDNMSKYWEKRIVHVVQKREHHLYKDADAGRIITLPDHIRRLSATRQYVLDHTKDKYIILIDDDLSFAERRTRSVKLSTEDQPAIFNNIMKQIEEWLKEGYVHCGISAREGNNYVLDDFSAVTRMMRILAYNTHEVKKIGARFDRVEAGSDFDMTLQLLKAGYPNIVSYRYATNQKGSNTSGGCSTYRTKEFLAREMKKLADLHPGIVHLREKQTKSSWGGGTRTDVAILWKKAYKTATE